MAQYTFSQDFPHGTHYTVTANAVERALEGASLDATGVAPALAAATEGLNPPDDPLASAWFDGQSASIPSRRLELDVSSGGQGASHPRRRHGR